MKGYQALARTLVESGVKDVFGVLGDGNMLWASAYTALSSTNWRAAWHEAGAVWMAAGYAVATGRIGVASVTMGPGLLQSLAALATASRTRQRVLVVTAEVAPSHMPHAQDGPQESWVHACGATYRRVTSPSELAAGVTDALADARSGLPCVLAVRLDIFMAEVGDTLSSPTAASGEAGPGSAPDASNDSQLQAAGELLRNARSPLVVIGGGVFESGCLAAVLDLSHRLGAPITATLGAKRNLSDEMFDLGTVGMMASPLARKVADGADVILVLGSSLDAYNTDGGTLGRSAHTVRVDRRPPDQLWQPVSRRVVHLTGDAGELVGALLDLIPPTDDEGPRPDRLGEMLSVERSRVRSLADVEFAGGPNPWAVVQALDEALPSDAYLVVGIGHFWYFVAPHLRATFGRRFHFTSGFALIGQALPTAIGAAVGLAASGRRVVAIDGDGSLAMNLQELQSAVRFEINLEVVVLNNRSYGSEFHKLVAAGRDPALSNFERPMDYAAVAEAMGATAWRAPDVRSLRMALLKSRRSTGVRLVDVAIARSPMSEVYEREQSRGE